MTSSKRLFSLICTGLGLASGPLIAAFSLQDIEFWVGTENGPAVSRAGFVIDWHDGSPPLAWGFRWISGETPSGQEMMAAIVRADPRLDIAGMDSGFVQNFAYDVDQDGSPERFRPGWDGVDSFWNYFVNNDVYDHPTDFTLNSHIVPPDTEVRPNGNPFAGVSPGTWVASNTGIVGRPVVDGSWDGFIYGDGSAAPGTPVAAPVPEPGSGFLLLLTLAGGLFPRRRKTSLASTQLA